MAAPASTVVVEASNNTSYSKTLVNQKYSPLAEIDTASMPEKTAALLFDKRTKILSDLGLFPRALILTAKAWPKERGTPAIIVLSSNRAEFIAAAMEAELGAALKDYKGYTDTRAFTSDMYLWYTPLRTQPSGKPRRPTYIVVHQYEFDYYQSLLGKFSDVCVVGWQFEGTGFQVLGFGASRFAALELGKALQVDAAWVVDDNLSQINAFPNTLEEVETQLGDKMWAIGFVGCTACSSQSDFFSNTKVNFTAKAVDVSKEKPGLLQQVVLWNMKLLRQGQCNVHPCFIRSNEDVSFINYLSSNAYDHRQVSGLSVMKLDAPYDKKNAGAATMERIKTSLLMQVVKRELDVSIKPAAGNALSLMEYVKTVVLPNSSYQDAPLDVATCQAVEQILAKAALSRKLLPANFFSPYLKVVKPVQLKTAAAASTTLARAATGVLVTA